MEFEIVAKCPVTNARVSRMKLAHGVTMLPTFMPVATQAAIKGLTPQQVESLGINLILNNTYHLNLRPGIEVLKEAGGAHKFQGWNHNLLTRRIQLVSLNKCLFESPFDGQPTMLTPEESISIQHAIGADIIMQLDDVVSSLTTGPRVEEAMWRTIRWLDRCIETHEKSGKTDTQNLFAIVQGGLDSRLRDLCVDEMISRKDRVAGYAIGGLSGGEEKGMCKRAQAARVIKQCADKLPFDRPRYSMGVGFAEDLLVCVALGVDMADCVFPTRTARFGHQADMKPIDDTCPCPTCSSGTTRAALHHLVTLETVGAHAVTQHNLVFQARLMGRARDAIINGTYPDYLKSFFADYFGDKGILSGKENIPVVTGSGAVWDRAE
ncbi:tRNA-guanine transglycosylase [Irpex lacteus]|nr:tRNA-guanine transglycosylase [Irpex lacteus]